MKKVISLFTLLLTLCTTATQANDGVYFTSGNFLIPLQETNIAALREVLTITIGRDSFATVDVYYELLNNGQPRTLQMGFEASTSDNSGERLNPLGIHPDICNFTVVMNGVPLNYRNGVVAFDYTKLHNGQTLPAIDPSQWKGQGEAPDSVIYMSNSLYNARLDSTITFAYAYYFDAPFNQGVNTVHHTYRYRMGYNVSERFSIPYWLTPITRWANHQVDDFTLRIKAEDTTPFCLVDSLFRAAPFTSKRGNEIMHLSNEYGTEFIYTTLQPNDTVEWHAKDFCPTADMYISAPSWEANSPAERHRLSRQVVKTPTGEVARYLANCGDSYFVSLQDDYLVKKKGSKLFERSAEKGEGYLVINSDEARCVNVRQHPSTKSCVLTTVCDNEGGVPDVYPCLGLVSSQDRLWFRTRVNGKVGYVSQRFMLWDAVNTY